MTDDPSGGEGGGPTEDTKTIIVCSEAQPHAAQPHPAAPPAPARARRRDARRDGGAPGRAAGAGEPAAVPLPARPAHRLRPVRRHPRRSRTHAGPAADDARHHPPAHARRRARAAAVDPARDRPGAAQPRTTPTCPAVRSPRAGADAAARHAGRARGGVVYAAARGWLGAAAARARRPETRAPLPARLRPGLRRRRDRLVGRHPARSGDEGDGRPGAARGRGRQGALRRARRRDRRRGRPARPRLLGTYDNVWLSHAGRDRVTDPEKRKALDGRQRRRRRWCCSSTAGSRGSGGATTGRDRGCSATLTRAEQAELDEEIARVEELLAR